jgi:hypothetical protein
VLPLRSSRAQHSWRVRKSDPRCCSAARTGESFGLFIIGLYPDANPFTNERSHLRSSTAWAVQFPLRKLPSFIPRGAPGLSPPCKRHCLRQCIAGRWHAVPARVRAPHFAQP